MDSLWFEVALVTSMFAFGGIVFGNRGAHAAVEKSPVGLSAVLGRAWALAFLGMTHLGVVYIHAIWLSGKGISGWMGEPKDKSYELRGWRKRE